MLGFVAEYIPKSGALGLSIMGGAGMVATSVVIGIMGKTMEAEGTQKNVAVHDDPTNNPRGSIYLPCNLHAG